jgi:ribosomal protein S18 acetylase RimI-like enzyme
MITYNILRPDDNPTQSQKDEVADFLFTHLDQYGDKREDIMRCLDYALGTSKEKGGFVLIARDPESDDAIVGTVVINRTGMSGYIPDNILVYIATHGGYRGRGIGKQLMQHTLEAVDGDVALHVEPDNPAKLLYEKFGFTNKYLEMRFHRNS